MNFVLRAGTWGGQCCVHGWEREKQCEFVIEDKSCIFTLSEPHLKSGMPAEVLIPAPEWTTKYWDSFINWARVSTFAFSSSGLSNTCHRTHNIKFNNSWMILTQSNTTIFFEILYNYKEYLGVMKSWEGMLSFSILWVSVMVSEKTM